MSPITLSRTAALPGPMPLILLTNATRPTCSTTASWNSRVLPVDSTASSSSFLSCAANRCKSRIGHCRRYVRPFSNRVHTVNCGRCRSTPRYRFISSLLLLWSRRALRRSPLSHPSSLRPYGDASVAGLTNLLNQVLWPHRIDAARNLPAPQLLPWSVPPQKLGELFMPSPLSAQDR